MDRRSAFLGGGPLCAMTRALEHLPKVDVIQVAGIPGGLEISQNPLELVRRLTNLSGGKAYPIYGPMWTEDPTLASAYARSLLWRPQWRNTSILTFLSSV